MDSLDQKSSKTDFTEADSDSAAVLQTPQALSKDEDSLFGSIYTASVGLSLPASSKYEKSTADKNGAPKQVCRKSSLPQLKLVSQSSKHALDQVVAALKQQTEVTHSSDRFIPCRMKENLQAKFEAIS